MATVAHFMTRSVHTIQPQESLRRAAQCMRDLNVSALPVCTGGQLLGMLTDRDLAVRAVADGLHPDEACVSDVMSPGPVCCDADQDAEAALRLMDEWQLRRLPVLDARRRLAGIVSRSDLVPSTAPDGNTHCREFPAGHPPRL